MPADAPSLRDTIESALNASPAPEPGESSGSEVAEVAPVETAPQETEAEAEQRARDDRGGMARRQGSEKAGRARARKGG